MDETNSEWMSVQGLAEEIGVPVASIYAWRSRGLGPRAHKIGRFLRFRRSPDVEQWLAEQAEERPGGPVPGSATATATPPSAAA